MTRLRACALRSGGWAVIWWMLFQDPDDPDDFDHAVHALMGGDLAPGAPVVGPPFQLDTAAREAELGEAGLTQISSEVIRSRVVMTAGQVRALYATIAVVLRRSPAEQAALLDRIESEVLERHGGRVERTFVTAVYRGRKP